MMLDWAMRQVCRADCAEKWESVLHYGQYPELAWAVVWGYVMCSDAGRVLDERYDYDRTKHLRLHKMLGTTCELGLISINIRGVKRDRSRVFDRSARMQTIV
jgi:hypothetical protein